jgi:hypothetical protein
MSDPGQWHSTAIPTWLEEKDDAQLYCPLTAILAVKIKGQGAGITSSVQQRKDRQGFWRRFHK